MADHHSALPPIDLPRRTELATLDRATLCRLLEAGEEALACREALESAGSNVVLEILRGSEDFYTWRHYPDGDVYDSGSHCQYYYHAHPKAERPQEHGHFHTFLRAPGMPEGCTPVAHDNDHAWPQGPEALSHIVAVSIDETARATSLFTVNRWVTGDTWYGADDVCAMVDRFAIDHEHPLETTSRWLCAVLQLFRPLVHDLLHHRDRVVRAWQQHVNAEVYEDKGLEVTSQFPVCVDAEVARLRALLA